MASSRIAQITGQFASAPGGVLKDEVVVITGAAQGIGRATALLCASEGARVVVADLDEAKAQLVVDEIKKSGGTAIAVGGDVTKDDYPAKLVGATVAAFGGINHVNNAGFTFDKMLHTMSDDTFDIILNVHCRAPFRIIREAAPYFRAKDAKGLAANKSIVNVSSTSGLHGNTGQVNYAIAKAGVVGLTKTIAKEWGPFNVRCNTVAFGYILTRLTQAKELGETIVVDGKPVALGIPGRGAAASPTNLPDTPLGRPGTPEEGAKAILFLLSPLASYISGHTLEWEKNPELAKEAALILKSKKFAPIPEFQLVPLPSTNPILLGDRWKEYHIALGPSLEDVPKESWEIYKEEKTHDMLTVLDLPQNAEPPRPKLMESHITPNPNPYFFVRNHGGIPTIKDEDYTFEVGGLIGRPDKMDLAELKDPAKFPQVEMTISLQCSGTRRVEQIALYPGEGDELLSAPWAEGAIGTAVWKGVQLKKVLNLSALIPISRKATSSTTPSRSLGRKSASTRNEWEAAPQDSRSSSESGRLRLHWSEKDQVAYQNPCSQGAFNGARPETRISLFYNQQVGKHTVAFSKGFQIGDMPVSSAILFPADRAVLIHEGFVDVSGWAYSGGGHWVERVELSSDGGFTWFEVPHENLSPKYHHAMRLWHMKLPVHADGWPELVARCWDSSLNTQPSEVRTSWNWTLHVTSSAHRVTIYSANRTLPETGARVAKLEESGEALDPVTRPVQDFPLEPKEEYLAAMAARGPREPRE